MHSNDHRVVTRGQKSLMMSNRISLTYYSSYLFFSDLECFYKSDVVKKSKNPEWERKVSSFNRICKGDKDRNIMIVVRDDDWGRQDKPNILGRVDTSMAELKDAFENGTEKKLKLGSGAEKGTLKVLAYEED